MDKLSRPVKRIVVLILGWIFIVLGVIGLFLPVLQGVLFLLAGLYLLSRESIIARRLLNWLRQRYPALDRKVKAWADRFRGPDRCRETDRPRDESNGSSAASGGEQG